VRVLVTGGAGYIGSHTAKALAKAGYEPIVFDNLSEGHEWAVKWGPLIEADLSDRHRLEEVIRQYDVKAIIHFAAHAYVGESMREPRRYFQNNVSNTLILLDVALQTNVQAFVFSSSCAIYGVPQHLPISEAHPKQPVNPYGESKLFIERALDWYGAAYGFQSASLRYFNAAGADPEGELGELHDPETHIIPLVIEAAMGQRSGVEIYGLDYPTDDGSAIRDFVHVSDLADAHVAALGQLLKGRGSFAVNLGTGRGVSVLEVVGAVEKHAGVSININPAPRRPGDPAALVSDPSQAISLLDWGPRRSAIEDIVSTAWRWRQTSARINCRTEAGQERFLQRENSAVVRLPGH
jgi:UDP-glucose-4-epimerase GalE